MEALHAAISFSEVGSIDSDISRLHEALGDKACSQRRGRKQAKPLRSAFSSDTPAESQPLAGLQQQSAFMMGPSSGDSPILNNHAGLEEVQAALPQLQTISNSSSSKGGKNSPAQRHGPCGHCKTPYSPQWRKGPRNKPVLCNACGIRYLRNRHLGRSVPQKKRCSVSSVKNAAHADSMCETSVDTLTDTSDMRTQSRKRRAKRSDMADEDTSAYSYDASQQETAGSVGSHQQLFLQQHHQHIYNDTAADTDAATGHSSDVSVPDNGSSGVAGATAAAGASAVNFGTSLALPGNMQQLPLTMHSLASGGSLLSGSYSMALALQIYQQQQQQLLYNHQQLLMSQASSDTSGLQAPRASLLNSSSAASALQSQNSYSTGTLSQDGTAGQAASAAAAAATTTVPLLYSQSLQMQNLHSYLLQQHQQAQVLHSASMLHGPSPLSAMSSASFGHSLAGLGGAGSFTAMLHAPVSTTLPAVPVLEIAPLVCGDYPISTSLPATSAAAPAANTAGTVAPSTAVLGSFQSLLVS